MDMEYEVEGFRPRRPGKSLHNYKCGPMPNVMATLPNIGGALCSMPQSLADAQHWNAVPLVTKHFTN